MISINHSEVEFQGTGEDLLVDVSLVLSKLTKIIAKEHGEVVVIPSFIAVASTVLDNLSLSGEQKLADQLKLGIYRMSKMLFPDEGTKESKEG